MPYNPALDGIRGIAVLLVVIYHLGNPSLPRGYLGVDVFFVLSGFLITSLLQSEIERTGSLRLRRFYWHRFLRLGPPLLAMLLVYLLTAPYAFPSLPMSHHLEDAALAAFYLSDFSGALWERPTIVLHTWSLSVEEHYYLLWPLGLLALKQLSRARLIGAMAALYGLATAWRLLALAVHTSTWDVYYRFDARISGLILGGLLAAWISRGVPGWFREWHANALGSLAIAVIGIAATKHPFEPGGSLIWGTIPVEWATACLIASVVARPTGAIGQCISARALVALGMCSYSLYLWHAVIMKAPSDGQGPEWALMTVILSGTAAAASYFLIERPIRKFRHKHSAARDALYPAIAGS